MNEHAMNVIPFTPRRDTLDGALERLADEIVRLGGDEPELLELDACLDEDGTSVYVHARLVFQAVGGRQVGSPDGEWIAVSFAFRPVDWKRINDGTFIRRIFRLLADDDRLTLDAQLRFVSAERQREIRIIEHDSVH